MTNVRLISLSVSQLANHKWPYLGLFKAKGAVPKVEDGRRGRGWVRGSLDKKYSPILMSMPNMKSISLSVWS